MSEQTARESVAEVIDRIPLFGGDENKFWRAELLEAHTAAVREAVAEAVKGLQTSLKWAMRFVPDPKLALDGYRYQCGFCYETWLVRHGAPDDPPKHRPDCPYAAARALLDKAGQ